MVLSAPSPDDDLPPPARRRARLVDTGARQAGRIVSSLIEHAVLTAETTRAPLHLAFPAALASHGMGLFPERTT